MNFDYDDSEWISTETTDRPPHPSETHYSTHNTYHGANARTETDVSIIGFIVGLLAGVWDAIIRIRNVVVYIILLIVSILFWPIGVFLVICLIFWVFKEMKEWLTS